MQELNYEGIRSSRRGSFTRRERAAPSCSSCAGIYTLFSPRGGSRGRGRMGCQFMREHCQMEREREGKRAANRLNGLSDEGGMGPVIERVPPAGPLSPPVSFRAPRPPEVILIRVDLSSRQEGRQKRMGLSLADGRTPSDSVRAEISSSNNSQFHDFEVQARSMPFYILWFGRVT